MIAYGTTKTSSAFKLLARARELDFDVSNEISKQIQRYEKDVKHAKENNEDDPDYNVDDEIILEDYIEDKYLDLVNESKQYKNIIMSVGVHPCARLVYHKDLREEIGIIRIKSKSGNKEPVYCVCIDGATADHAGYTKSDILKVIVTDTINKTFNKVNKPVLTVNELLKAVELQPEVWDIYANGFTMGLNQTEQEKTTQRVQTFKPKNIIELCHFVASIRPGSKNLVEDFVNRRFHNYGIPALDELLKLKGATGITGQSSYLFYDENILAVSQEAEISPEESYKLIKAVKKKVEEVVRSFGDKFIKGFTKYLMEKENANEELAVQTSKDVFTTIKNSAQYLFNLSHSYAVALDSLYGAYLKYNYPYEFYTVMLQTWTTKGNQDKVVKIIDEMKRYKGIKLVPAKFGQDNRDWYVDKTNHTISQSLASLKFISQPVAEDLYNCKDMQFESFVDFLRYIQMNTCLDKTNIEVLIKMGYFEQFGNRNKLMDLFREFREGTKLKCKIEKKTKSWEKRLETLRNYERQLVVDPCTIEDIVRYEQEYMGICVSTSPTAEDNEFLISEVDDKYGVKIMLYSIKRGTRGKLKVRKDLYEKQKPEEGQIILTKDCKKLPRRSYKNGVSTVIPGEFEWWLRAYDVLNK